MWKALDWIICSWKWNRAIPIKRVGMKGEFYAKHYLCKHGMKFLASNFAGKHGEIDLIFRAKERLGDQLVFVEVKTRTEQDGKPLMIRPASAVDQEKQKHLHYTIKEYLKHLRKVNQPVPWRVDVVEVIFNEKEKPKCINHIPSFSIRKFFSKRTMRPKQDIEPIALKWLKERKKFPFWNR